MSAMDPGLVLWPTNTCMLSALAANLANFDGDDLANCAVVLPTQRLATALIALLAGIKGTFRPPVIRTLDVFVRENSMQGPDLREPAPDMIQEILICNIIKQGNYQHLHLGHEHELKQFFGELSENGLGGSGLDLLIEAIKSDYYHSDTHIQSLVDRFAEMKDVQQKFFSLLSKRAWSNQPEVMSEQTRRLTEQWAQLDQLPWKQVYFACFTTIKPYYLQLFTELLRKPNGSLWLSQSPQLYGAIHPLRDLAQGVKAPAYVAKSEHDSAVLCNVHESDNIMSECGTAIAIAEHYLQLGLQPSQIALLLTNEKLHGKLIRNLVVQRSLAANLAIAHPLGQTIIGGWFTQMRQVLLSKESAGDILNFATHPISMRLISRHLGLADSGSIDALKAQIGYEICTQSSFHGFAAIGSQVKDSHCQAALALVARSFAGFLSVTGDQANMRSLTGWAELLHQFFILYDVFEFPVSAEKGIQNSIQVATAEFFDHLLTTGDILDPNMTLSEFLRLATDQFNSLDARSIGYPLEGLQVLSLVESRYVPFQVAIVVGCTEGNFPKALPADNLVDDWLKQRIGLPGWKYVEALEDNTFHLLAARLPHLELSYAKEEKGQPTVRSRFIEAHLSAAKTLPFYWNATDHVANFLAGHFEVNPLQPIARNAPPGIYPGIKSEFFRRTSATSLKHLICCPYRFLLYKLGIAPLSLPEESRPQIEGQWLHQILESFFTGKLGLEQSMSPLHFIATDPSQEDLWLERLRTLTHKILPPQEIGTPFYHQLVRYSWGKFCRHLRGLVADSEPFIEDYRYKEFKLGSQATKHRAEFTLGAHFISIQGSIDSIDRFGPIHLLTDYKRKHLEGNREVRTGLAPQLGLYALAMESLSDKDKSLRSGQGVLGYWSILNGEWKTQAVGESAREWAVQHKIASKKTPGIDQLLKNLKDLWLWRLDSIHQPDGRFAPDPSPQKWCSHCDYTNICRLNDPQLRRGIQAEQELEQRLDRTNDHADSENP